MKTLSRFFFLFFLFFLLVYYFLLFFDFTTTYRNLVTLLQSDITFLLSSYYPSRSIVFIIGFFSLVIVLICSLLPFVFFFPFFSLLFFYCFKIMFLAFLTLVRFTSTFFWGIKQLIFDVPIAQWWYHLSNPVDALEVMLTAVTDYFSLTPLLMWIMVATAFHFFLSYMSCFFCRNWIRYVAFDIFIFQKKKLFTFLLTAEYLHFIWLR